MMTIIFKAKALDLIFYHIFDFIQAYGEGNVNLMQNYIINTIIL
jgi:hypothetical protein